MSKLSKTIIYADEKALDALGENRKVNVELGRPGKSYIIRRYIIGNNIIYMKNNTITEITVRLLIDARSSDLSA